MQTRSMRFSNILWQGRNAVMELGEGGRPVSNRKLGLGLEEPHLGRIHAEGGQLDGDGGEENLAIRKERHLILHGHGYSC